MANSDGIFEAIKHGDNNHQKWLQEKLADYYQGKTLIGTCGDCEHWERLPLTGICLIRPEYQSWVEDDGCRKWEEKESP